MTIKKIIEDVLTDFERRESIEIDKDFVVDFLSNKMNWSVEELGAEEVYALANEFVYCYMLDENNNLKDNVYLNMTSIAEEYLSDPLDWHIERNECFKWYPAELDEVYKDSAKLFNMAEDMYFKQHMSREERRPYVVKAVHLYDKIAKVEGKLRRLKYEYRSMDDIIFMHAQEVSECALDLDVVKGRTMFLSIRMQRFLETLDRCIEEPIDWMSDIE